MAQANTQIGIAKAAYYPNVTLSATGGFGSASIADWFAWPSRFWSVGPSLAETIFDAGLRRATVQQSQATYDQTVANYRQTVLTAFQQVEDNLAAVRILSQDIQQQDAAVQSAQRSLQEATVRYEAGRRSLPERDHGPNGCAERPANCGELSHAANGGERPVNQGARRRLGCSAASVAETVENHCFWRSKFVASVMGLAIVGVAVLCVWLTVIQWLGRSPILNGGGQLSQSILVPLDGSPLAELALPEALALAKLPESRVTLLHVIPPIEDVISDGEVITIDQQWENRRIHAMHYLESICTRPDWKNVKVAVSRGNGHPSRGDPRFCAKAQNRSDRDDDAWPDWHQPMGLRERRR